MYQGLRLNRFWLAFVVAVFCLPLFIGLGDADFETDEAIYSFSVDRMLETGDWLIPKLSPSETDPFLEKPPLKFWMVAAPIRLGLLPDNEFGLRFVDAVEGGAAFVYVFAIGSLLAGPVCGVLAVMLLFLHIPLVMDHGLRTNNMEASLVLSYCGGVFHFLRWAAIDDVRRRRRHAVWAGLFFALGFMTKFVAVAFLPFTLGVAALGSARVRRRLFDDLRAWLAVLGLVIAVCAPWFIYAQVRFGWQLWQIMLGVHVFERMTSSLDPTHLHPWSWYFQQIWREYSREGLQWLLAAGAGVLLVQTIRRRWFDGAVVLLWGALPLAIISMGTSKLYHYVFPFLPPVALAGGYLVALAVMLAPAQLRKVLLWLEARLPTGWPPAAARDSRAQAAASVLIALAAVAAVAGVAVGGVRLDAFGVTLRTSGWVRPVILILVLGLLTGRGTRLAPLVVALVAFGLMPLPAYRGQIERLQRGRHPIRTTAECLVSVDRARPQPAGIFMDMPDGVWHPLYYYFRRVVPVTQATEVLDPQIDRSLRDPSSPRPLLLGDRVWREYQAGVRGSGVSDSALLSPPMMAFLNTVLILPGPYAACSSEAALRSAR